MSSGGTGGVAKSRRALSLSSDDDDSLLNELNLALAAEDEYSDNPAAAASAAASEDEAASGTPTGATAAKKIALGGDSIEKYLFGLKNGLRFRFDSETCLKYPFLDIFLV